jgi:hypothetical protein
MRLIFGFGLVLCMASAGIAAPLDLGSFPVSGSGTFQCDPSDSVFVLGVSFAGSNANYAITAGAFQLGGSRTLNLQFTCVGASLHENVLLGDTYPPSFNAVQPFNANFGPAGNLGSNLYPANFQLGNGTGELNIYDQASAQPGNPTTLIATATLIGYVTVDSVQESGPPSATVWDGTYSITPDPSGGPSAPEPGSAMMLLMAALWPVAGAAACSVRRRIRTR